MRHLLFLSLFFLGCGSAIAQGQKLEFVLVDGQYVVKSVPINSTQVTKDKIQVTNPSLGGDLHQGVVDTLYPELVKTMKYWTEGTRAAEAKDKAERAAREAVSSSGASFAVVGVIADNKLEFTDEPQLNRYSVGSPETSDDIHELRKSVFGPVRDELAPAGPGTSELQSGGHLRYAIVATKDAQGNVTTRMLNKSDEESYLSEENKRIANANAARAAELEKKRKDAEAAEAQLEEKKRKERQAAYEAEQARLREQEKEARAREKQARDNQAAVEKRMKERDEACSGGRTASCAVIDDALTNDFEKIKEHQNTALCAFNAGDGPAKGPCAPGAPPCMYCRAGDDLDRQQRYESFVTAQTSIRINLASKGITDKKSIDGALKKFLKSKTAIEQFGLQDFTKK